VHIDIEANNNVCGHCKTRYEGIHRAPGGVLVYDQQAALSLIVGVRTKLKLKPGFVPGLPTTAFQASSAAVLAAKSLEDLLLKVTEVRLPLAIKELLDVYSKTEVAAKALVSSSETVGQLQEAASRLSPLSSNLNTQSLDVLEKELADLKLAEKAAAEVAAATANYAETQALATKHAQMSQELREFRKFKSECLDPLKVCCNKMVTECQQLAEHAKRADIVQKTAGIWTRSKEYNMAAGVLARELDKTSLLADCELLWLRSRELSSLKSTASTGSQGIMQNVGESTSLVVALMQQADERWKQALQCRLTAQAQLTVMQELLGNTASKPLAMQQQVRNLLPQDTTIQLQRVVDNVPKANVMELDQKTKIFVDSLMSLVSPSVDLLKKAPVMPDGVTLNESTGEIGIMLHFPVSNCAFKVLAFNDTGQCACSLVLSAKGQIIPSGLTYAATIPVASEFATPPQSTGLLLVGDAVSIKPSYDHAGLPAGTFSIQPALPAGLLLHDHTGEIYGTPDSASERRNYIVTMENPSGKSGSFMGLEVQNHAMPGPLEYDAALRTTSTRLHKICKVGEGINPIMPTKFDAHNHLLFSVSPLLPEGMKVDPKTGAIVGMPMVATGKTVYSITARNKLGKTSVRMVFAVAGDWKIAHPKDWTTEMCLTWLKEELNFSEDDQSHFSSLDGKQMLLLRGKEAVASRFSLIQPSLQVLIALSVNSLLGKWETSEQKTLLQRPVGVKTGDTAQLEYFPHELRKEYVPSTVLGVGAYGVVVSADVVKNGHVKYKTAVKLVFADEGSRGFSDAALRRLDREATILGRLKHQHIVVLLSFDISESKDVFWLVMEHLDGSSLDVIMHDCGMSFDEDSIRHLACQMLSALIALHHLNLIHRDVKPSNIVKLNGSTIHKLIDLGAAAVVDMHNDEVSNSLKTQRTVCHVAGTHGFMPPEAYREPQKMGACSDIFSLSVTLFYLASRGMPFRAKNEYDWIFVIAGSYEEQAPKLMDVCPTISSRLSDIIARGLHKKIEKRYSNATEMMSDVESLRTHDLSALGDEMAFERKHWTSDGKGSRSKFGSSHPQNPPQLPNCTNLFLVSPTSEEFGDIAARFLKTMPMANVVQIDRVENGAMHQSFSLQASTLKKQMGAEWDRNRMRQMLFHGTEALDIIVNSVDGYCFLPLLAGSSTGAIWGDGTYFARDAQYSNDYAKNLSSQKKQMLLVDVLVGQSAQGAKSMKMCPLLPGEKYKRYNSLVDTLDKPSIFVVQHSNQTYPAYVLTYHT